MKEDFPHRITEKELAKYFSGEANERERAAIESWANQSHDNREFLIQAHVVWADTGQVNPKEIARNKVYDSNAAWEKVKAQRKLSTNAKKTTSPTWRVAASILLILSLGFLIRYYLNQPVTETVIAENSTVSSTLPDSSKILLNKNSKISFTNTFGGEERLVSLEGEAFFQVVPDPEKPFIVKAGETEIKVLGTSFNIKTSEQYVSVFVETGLVQFSSPKGGLRLSAGESAKYSVSSSLLEKEVNRDAIRVDQYWRTKTLRFTGNTLPEVADALEAVYNTKINIAGDHLNNCSLSVTFQNDSLQNVMEIISLTLNLKVTKTNDGYTLSGEGCSN